MKKKVFSLSLVFVSTFLIFACTNSKNKKAHSEAYVHPAVPSKGMLWANIVKLEDSLKNVKSTNNLQGENNLLSLYKAYIKYYPKEKVKDKIKHCEFEAGRLAMNLNHPKEAITLFQNFRRDFPTDSVQGATSLFLMAFTYEKMNQLGEAKTTYQQFIQEYPNNKLVKDAKLSIQDLGKSPEQLVKEFEAKNKKAKAQS